VYIKYVKLAQKQTNFNLMLIEFSVGNFKSIKEIETLSMHASNLQSKYPHLEINNLFEKRNEELRLLKSKAIYGANASGKSNIYKALGAFKKIVENSVGNEKILSRNITPFRLCDTAEKEPSFFQIQFIKDEVIYRYGFLADEKKIHSEWLFKKVERETPLFTREGDESEINNSQFSEGEILKEITKKSEDNTTQNSYLFLTFLAKVLNGKISSELLDYISNEIVLVSGLDSYLNKQNAEIFIENKQQKSILVSLVKAADMGIDNIDYVIYKNEDNADDKEKLKLVLALKKKYDRDNNEAGMQTMSFDFEESKGTQKMFELAPYIINTLSNGGLLFIDEFDSRFHSLLTKKIVELFNSKSNSKAQLIFITHDTNLLSSKLLRRDQISFASRDKYGVSHFYSLAEFKGVRSSSSYENDYIHGKYGAIPSLNDFEEFFVTEDG